MIGMVLSVLLMRWTSVEGDNIVHSSNLCSIKGLENSGLSDLGRAHVGIGDSGGYSSRGVSVKLGSLVGTLGVDVKIGRRDFTLVLCFVSSLV